MFQLLRCYDRPTYSTKEYAGSDSFTRLFLANLSADETNPTGTKTKTRRIPAAKLTSLIP